MLEKLPGMSNVPQEMKDKVNDKELARQIAVIGSMTMQERRYPDLIKGRSEKAYCSRLWSAIAGC